MSLVFGTGDTTIALITAAEGPQALLAITEIFPEALIVPVIERRLAEKMEQERLENEKVSSEK